MRPINCVLGIRFIETTIDGEGLYSRDATREDIHRRALRAHASVCPLRGCTAKTELLQPKKAVSAR